MEVYHDILSTELFKGLREFSRRTKLVNTNLTQWSRDVSGWSTPIICQELPYDLVMRCKEELGLLVAEKYRELPWACNVHLGSRLSYIPWHNDANHKVNITVYLHERWDLEHAGYFLYEDAPGWFRAIWPLPNLGLVYETPLLHSVALANLNAPLRESLQIFINEPEA